VALEARISGGQIYRLKSIFFKGAGRAGKPSFQLPAHTGKYFVYQPLVRLVDESEFEPAIAAEGIQTSRELDLRTGSKVL
jgi:hypothetical protein